MNSKLRNQANATIIIQNSSQVEHCAILFLTASWLKRYIGNQVGENMTKFIALRMLVRY